MKRLKGADPCTEGAGGDVRPNQGGTTLVTRELNLWPQVGGATLQPFHFFELARTVGVATFSAYCLSQ